MLKKKARNAKQRATTVTVDEAISTLVTKAKVGLNFVCVCCNRMMYKLLFPITNLKGQ